MIIKTNKSARDDRGCSTMNVSLDGDRISRKKKKEKLSETSITGNKIAHDQYNISKEAKFDSSIKGTKTPSILTPPPYANKKDYNCGTNYKTCNSHTH